MTIYVGRWDLLPKSWEGINGLYEKEEKEISDEINRQMNKFYEKNGYDDNNIGRYTATEFEETFNQDLDDELKTSKYFIKIF